MTKRHITNFSNKNKKYCFNGVTYTAESRFEKSDIIHFVDNNHFKHRIQKYLTGDFAELSFDSINDKMTDEYDCSTVGKED